MKQPPCYRCSEKGCGKQGQCADYLAWKEKKDEQLKDRANESLLNSYTSQAIRRVKTGTFCTLKKYRSKER